MTRRRRSRPHVALFIESSLEYGRGLLRGIARYLRERGPWSIFLEQRELGAALPGRARDRGAAASARARVGERPARAAGPGRLPPGGAGRAGTGRRGGGGR